MRLGAVARPKRLGQTRCVRLLELVRAPRLKGWQRDALGLCGAVGPRAWLGEVPAEPKGGRRGTWASRTGIFGDVCVEMCGDVWRCVEMCGDCVCVRERGAHASTVGATVTHREAERRRGMRRVHRHQRSSQAASCSHSFMQRALERLAAALTAGGNPPRSRRPPHIDRNRTRLPPQW